MISPFLSAVCLRLAILQVFDRADFANTIRPGPQMYQGGHVGSYAVQPSDLERVAPPGNVVTEEMKNKQVLLFMSCIDWAVSYAWGNVPSMCIDLHDNVLEL